MRWDVTSIILVEMYKLKETYECQYKRRNTIVNEKYCGAKRVAFMTVILKVRDVRADINKLMSMI